MSPLLSMMMMMMMILITTTLVYREGDGTLECNLCRDCESRFFFNLLFFNFVRVFY